MGKARSELLEKFDIAEAGLFRGSLNNYKEHNYTYYYNSQTLLEDDYNYSGLNTKNK